MRETDPTMDQPTLTPGARSEPDAAPDAAAWPAPRLAPGTRLAASVDLPGSKSLTNRLLVLAALAEGPSRIRLPLRARDTELMAAALRSLGVEVRDEPDGSWTVTPRPMRGPAEVDCGLAGTVLRFLPPVATLADGPIRFDGDPRIRERPNGPLLHALRDLGAQIEDEGRLAAPFTVYGAGSLPGGAVDIDARSSSQLITGLLLSAPRYDRGLTLRPRGGYPSAPHIEMTLAMLTERGSDVTVDRDESGAVRAWTVAPGHLTAADTIVEPDLSTAAPFAAAALATGGTVILPGWPTRTTQPGAGLPRLLESMGATCSLDDDGLRIEGSGPVVGLDADLREVTELVPVLAALAALAESPSRFTGIAHMRGHETDRIDALATELSELGADVVEHPDGLEIFPGPLQGRRIRTYDDHRMVMFAAVIGLAVPEVTIAEVSTVAKTMPEFTARWQAMLS